MKMFSDCSGKCCVCFCGWNYKLNKSWCLAGHGDDDFSPAPKEYIIARIKNNKYSSYTQYMLDYIGMTMDEVMNYNLEQ